MIKSRAELREYIKADESRNGKEDLSIFLNFIKSVLKWHKESYYVCKYLHFLRKYEYYYNNKGNSILNNLLCKYYYSRMNNSSLKYGIHINPNTVGKGLFIPHYAGGIYINAIQLGNFCTVSSGVVIGNKKNQSQRAIIGDNVELCVGCKVIGKVKIGDNVIVAPNSVVIKDIPTNTTVSGIPAKVIKIR